MSHMSVVDTAALALPSCPTTPFDPGIGSGDSSTKKRKRLTVGCQGCRARHFKCDTNIPSCMRCTEAKIECVRGVNVRFRNVNVQSKESELQFLTSQTWLPLENSVQFHDETPYLKQLYNDNSPPGVPEVEKFINYSGEFLQEAPPLTSGSSETLVEEVARNLPQPGYDDYCSGNIDSDGQSPGIKQSGFHQNLYQTLHEGQRYTNTGRGHSIPQESEHAAISSPSSAVYASPTTIASCDRIEIVGPLKTTALLTEREAVLMRHFIENMALWADITDLKRHFEIEVPRRALYQPVLRLAIFAFSSRHISRHVEHDGTEAIQYHNECVQLLLRKLSELNEEINEDVLAAIAILRQYEEMDAYDNRCHLIGTTRILNSISTFGSSGGLGEAAAWLCLRQDIYVSLVSQQPLRTHLENYNNSKTFQKNDDVSRANRMVFLLAKVLSYAFLPDQSTSMSMLQQIDQEVEEWNVTKPSTFEPIRFVSRSLEQNRAFPEIWLLSPVHVVALQYYHIAKLVLKVSTRPPQVSGYENLRQGRQIEKTVRSHLLMILGLATSNRTAQNTLFTARHTLSVWGGVLRDELERKSTVTFLLDMEQMTGWRAADLIQSLREQWDEDLDVN